MNWLRALGALSLVSAVSLSSTGCAPSGPAEPDTEEPSESGTSAVTSSQKCDVSNLGSPTCQDALASVRLQAYAVGRSDIVERGIDWVSRGITYDAGKSFQGYRRDCSGFVSMTWQYKANPGTIAFPPFSATGQYAIALDSFDDLAPGDAINKTVREKNSKGQLVGHVMLFGGWATADHQEMYLIHEYSPGKPAALVRARRDTIGPYIAIRASNAAPPTAPVAAPSDPAPAPDPTPVAPAAPGCGKLVANQSLGLDQAATSCDGRFALVQQSDGNLVLYRDGGKALWSTQTMGKGGQTTVMQDDGNLVIYGASGAIWSSQTWGHPGAWLGIHDDGSLIVHDTDGTPIWWDGTGGL